MADLAIGISKSVVEKLVNKVKTAVKEEAEKWQILQRDIVFIKDEFEMMESFLNTTGGERMKNNQVARTWVRQVRNLSYDTEDCIEFVLHLDTKRSFWQSLLRPNVVPTMLPLDQAVAEIKQLKAQAEDVNKRNIRYSLTGTCGQQMPTSADRHRTLDVLIKQREAFDNQTGILGLTRLIKTEGKDLQVIMVCGTGGDLGTISIIKKGYDEPEICKTFERQAWVKLMHPFNPHEFIRSLLVQFYTNSPREGGQGDDVCVQVLEKMEAAEHIVLTDFMERIKDKPYLIVLEDLSSIVEWNAITTFLPNMKNGSRVVVSTQQLEIASLCTGEPYHVWLLLEFSTDHSVYAFSKEIPENSKFISCLLHGYHIREGRKRASTVGCRSDDVEDWYYPKASHCLQKHGLVGRESELNQLWNLVSPNCVTSVYGIAGAGKSFLVEAFYNHYGHIEFESLLVVSAPHPFDIMNFCQSLALEFNLEQQKGEDIFLSCRRHLENHECLVVIDGLRSKEDWDLIEGSLMPRQFQSSIIVINWEESVARHCATSADAVCSLKGLEADAAHRLFKVTLMPDGTTKADSNMMDDVEFILEKCGRLPKLIVSLAKYLAEVPNVTREARRLNANFMYALKTSKGLGSFREVFNWMYSRFQTCPQLLRKCIFYLSLFTQSSIIRQSRLVRRWIAEGYSEGTDSHSMVEYMEKLIHELVTIGMMEALTKPGDMRMTSCQVNSLFLDYFISRETEENIFLPLEVSVLVQESSLNTQRAGQHLAIGSSWKRDRFVFESLDFSRLRSLSVSREWKPFFISDRMRVLRVLDLEDTSIKDDDVEQIVKQLPRLKFLSLRRCTKVSCLPDLLGGLRQLQTLDIRHTSVTKLPKGIVKLQKLQYIRAGTNVVTTDEEPSTSRRSRHGRVVDACDGVIVPRGIGALIALHTLGVVNVNTRGVKATLRELKNLTQLYKLGVSGVNRNNYKGLFSNIVDHSHLESLSLQLLMDKDLDWLGKLTPPGNLQRLKMHVHVDKYTHWSCLQALGQVRRLQTLSLRFKTDQDVELQFCDRMDSGAWFAPNQFCELKVLEIACTSNLHVKFADGEMRELELLKVRCFDGSSLKFSGIEHPSKLKHVWLKGSFDDTVKAELRKKVNLHMNKPALKLD